MDSVSIRLKVDGVLVNTHPVFGDDLKIKLSKEEYQAFHRAKIDGSVKFVGEDFAFIANSNHNATFTLSVYRGATLVGESNFLKSDCELNYSDKVATVKLKVTDKYEKFLANYDNKYNLVKLAPKCEALTLNKRPVLQFYFFGDNKITNSLGNMAFEVDAASGAEEKTIAQLTNTYKFTRVLSSGQVSIGTITPPYQCKNPTQIAGIRGAYRVTFNDSSIMTRLDKVGGEYSLVKYSGNTFYVYLNGSRLFAQFEDDEGNPYTRDIQATVTETGPAISVEVDVMMYDYESGSYYPVSIGTGAGDECTIFCRMLSDYGGTSAGESKVDLTSVSDDVAEENYNYRYAWTVNWLNIGANMIVSGEVQDEPTEYGIDSNGKYFVKPTPSIATNPVYPIGWNMWIPLSFWFEDTLSIYGSIDASVFNTQYSLPDAYPLSSAIQVLLKKVDSDISYEPNIDSKFLMGNDRGGLASFLPSPASRNCKLYITPITNVKKTRYEQAAQRGDITLKQILDMLRVVYDCYWYIDNGHLKIEHISFFKGGNSYAQGEPPVLFDVTTMKDMPNNLSWGYGQSEVSFDRNRCPSRYEFQWADACTEQFNGYAIDVNDKAASKDKKEKTTVANFMADIDYCVITPNAVSDDLYVLIEATVSSSHNVRIVSVDNGEDTPTYTLQNGYCSFLFAERNYLNRDLGGWDAEANGSKIDVLGTRDFATQNVNFPVPIGDVGSIGLVKTDLGTGEIKDAEVNIDTLYAKMKLILENAWEYARDIKVSIIESGVLRLYKITNTSSSYLKVSYVIVKKSDGTVVLSTQTTLAPNGYVDSFPYSANIYSVRILSAVPDMGEFTVWPFTMSSYGEMSLSLTKISDTSMSVEIHGNNTDTERWAYLCIVCKKAMTINLYAHSEATYDVGYVSYTPCTKRSEVTANAIKKVSGVETDSAYIPANTPVYIGYVKDHSDHRNGDYISFGVYATS